MRLAIDDEYFLVGSDTSVNLVRKIITQAEDGTKKELDKVVCFCANTEQALRWYIDKKLATDDSMEVVEEVIMAIQECQSAINDAVKRWGLTRKALVEGEASK